ncbi:MAG TPA: hypothetical protein VGK98_19365 [Arthrobacter sp.]|jgi:hypothetical protein|uniref:hypothetical protein n=1 Tax=Arthrobacter sp. TaxID=1667 RepID=UPI002F403CA0
MHLHLFAQPGSSGLYSAARFSTLLADIDESGLAELINLGYRYGTTVLHSR